jgi:hypothetical protein
VSFFPKNGELRNGERWDSFSKSWVRADEWQRRQWEREDAVFARRANQGQLTAPMIISDGLGLHGLQSQVDGKQYDSKSNMRRHYRQSGVVEVGNDGSNTRYWWGDKPRQDEAKDKRTEAALDRAMNRLNWAPV